MRPSLRRTLLTGTLAVVALIWIVLAVSAWRETRHEAAELFDVHLAQSAQLVAALDAGEADDIEEHLSAHRYARAVAFQVWAGGSRLVLRSASAPRVRLSPQENGYSDQGPWRVFSLRDDRHDRLIQVAELQTARDHVGRELAEHLLLPLLVALPLLGLALVLLIRHSLKPLAKVAEAIATRSPGHLEPIPAADAPREVRPVLDRLNVLLERLRRSLEQERNFTADAAHELRTPLAAIRVQAQVARISRDGVERDHALDQLIEAAARASQLIEQMLTIARLDVQSSAIHPAACDLRAVTAEVMAALAPTALGKDVELELVDGPAVAAVTEAGLLAILLRNLVDNAIRYSPPRSTVRVTIEPRGTDAVLEVEDEGPGIPEEELDRVFDRFHRVPGSQGNGAGLGLSIAVRIAAILGARLALERREAGPGLCVRVVLEDRRQA